MPRLDVAEAADLLRDGREPDRDRVVLSRELADDLAEQVKTADAVAGGGILISTMQVQRFSEGGTVAPIYF